jgi:hypothetical protein
MKGNVMKDEYWKYFEIGINTLAGTILVFSGHTLGIIAGIAALGLAGVQYYKIMK